MSAKDLEVTVNDTLTKLNSKNARRRLRQYFNGYLDKEVKDSVRER